MREQRTRWQNQHLVPRSSSQHPSRVPFSLVPSVYPLVPIAPPLVYPFHVTAQATHIGETIASSTAELLVQSAELHVLPPLGSIVAAGGLLAVVISAETGPIDSSRTAVALGLDGEDVAAAHPELAVLLRSTFRALPIATDSGGDPEAPAPLHAPVSPAAESAYALLAAHPHYFHRLLGVPIDVLVSHVRALGSDAPTRTRATEALIRALAHDPPQLARALRALDARP